MDKLIARLEAADGPDQQLDRDIERAVYTPGPYPMTTPAYTGLIEAALSLKDQDFDWFVGTDDDVPTATVYRPHSEREWVRAATPVIALCIAILKMRATRAQS